MSSDATGILTLDDDSLLHILKFMSLKDQLSLACAHMRFAGVFQMFAKTYIRRMFIHELENLTSVEIHRFFELAGEFLEVLTLPANFEQEQCEFGFTLIKLYCPNLKSLGLIGYSHTQPQVMHFKRFCELLLNKPKLKTLRLQGVGVKHVYMDLKTESELQQLEHLSVVGCRLFSGQGLKKFKNLKKLRLENLANLSSFALKDALLAMPNLSAFSYCAPYKIDDDFVTVLNSLRINNKNVQILELHTHRTNDINAYELPNLRHFTHGTCDNLRQRIDLSQWLLWTKEELKSLTIESVYDIELNDKHYRLISQFTNLQKLHLPFRNHNKDSLMLDDNSLKQFWALKNLVEFKATGLYSFTNNGLLDLVRNCKMLKWVNVQCSSINNDFAKGLISIIKGNKRKNGRITFLVWDTYMTRDGFPEDYSSKEMKQAVKFVFKQLRYLESYDNCIDDFENDNGLITAPFCSSD